MIFHIGLTGYGALDPMNLKIAAYSEITTLLIYGAGGARYSCMVMGLDSGINQNLFTSKPSNHEYNIFLKSDYSNKIFSTLSVIPKTSGDKKITLIATYSPDGESWYTTSREVSYHVNSWTEKYQTWLAIASLISIILAFPLFNVIISRWLDKRSMRLPKEKRKNVKV
ncbi:MAG: hypothetical protein HQK96_03715 [Nitrospirae bacterium]|nr:hypothetical protein [Nitrospirota bacterium]